MSSPSGNKRKADDITDKDGTDRPAPPLRKDDRHLPAPIWGHVLDYMPYEEVRSALLVGKIVANEAVKYVSALNIMKLCQMDGPSTRRFPNIEELNILCMYKFRTDELCKETCQRIVPLLAFFPMVKQVFAGGVDDDVNPVEYKVKYSDIDEDEEVRETFRVLVNHILSAYKMRALPQSIETMGSLCREALDLQRRFLNENPEGGSSFRKDICAHFPIKDLIIAAFQVNKFGEGYVDDYCKEIFRIIKGRPGGKEMMLNFSGQYLIDHVLNEEIRYADLDEQSFEEKSNLMQRLTEAGVRYRFRRHPIELVQYLTEKSLAQLDEVIALGFGPKSISQEDLYERMDIGNMWRSEDIFTKSTIDALVSRGFAFDEKDVIVLDETKEPTLSKIPALIRGISE